MKADRSPELQLIPMPSEVDRMAKPVTVRLPEPPVQVQWKVPANEQRDAA